MSLLCESILGILQMIISINMNPKPKKLLDKVLGKIRLKQYSNKTEQLAFSTGCKSMRPLSTLPPGSLQAIQYPEMNADYIFVLISPLYFKVYTGREN